MLLTLALALPTLAVGGCAMTGGGQGEDADAQGPQRYPVVVRNDNFQDVRVRLIFRNGTRFPVGVGRSLATTRLRVASELLLQDEFYVQLDLIGGGGYVLPDPIDFPADAASLEIYVRPVVEQSYASVR